MSLTTTESAALEAFVLFEVAISSLEIIANGGHQCCDKADLMAEAQNLLQMTRSDAVKAHKETGMMDEINRISAKNQEGK